MPPPRILSYDEWPDWAKQAKADGLPDRVWVRREGESEMHLGGYGSKLLREMLSEQITPELRNEIDKLLHKRHGNRAYTPGRWD